MSKRALMQNWEQGYTQWEKKSLDFIDFCFI